jgi:hypothetical protein
VQAAGRTELPLALGAHEAVFVVFRKPASAISYQAPGKRLTAMKTLTGAWRAAFPAGGGAPRHLDLPALASWTENPDPGVRYFSGTALYAKSVRIPPQKAGARLLLDLGQVANVARIRVNGRSVGYAWKSPYRVDITQAARTGRNRIEIEVANLWPNRLIGDRRSEGGARLAQAAYDPFTADSPLLESGLLGPVRLLIAASGAEADPPEQSP